MISVCGALRASGVDPSGHQFAAGAERVWARRIGEAALERGGAALWPDLTARSEGRGNA